MKSAAPVAITLMVLLSGCASSHDDVPDRGRVVIGSGSDQDRHDIEASNQQMFQTERAGIPTASTPAPPPPASTTPKPTTP